MFRVLGFGGVGGYSNQNNALDNGKLKQGLSLNRSLEGFQGIRMHKLNLMLR